MTDARYTYSKVKVSGNQTDFQIFKSGLSSTDSVAHTSIVEVLGWRDASERYVRWGAIPTSRVRTEEIPSEAGAKAKAIARGASTAPE